MKKKRNLLLTALAVVLLSGCAKGTFYDKHHTVDTEGWNMEEGLRFAVDIEDTQTPYDFYIDVRNAKDYAYSNLFLFITTTFPDKVERRDTLECPLADAYGRWYGRQTNRYVDGRYLLHQRVIFPMKGTYTFQINHAMRDTVVTGIKNIGLHVETASR